MKFIINALPLNCSGATGSDVINQRHSCHCRYASQACLSLRLSEPPCFLMFFIKLFQPVQRCSGKKAFLKPVKAVHLVLALFRIPEHNALICFVQEVRWLLKDAFELKKFAFVVGKLKSWPILGPTSLHWFHQPYPVLQHSREEEGPSTISAGPASSFHGMGEP